jgi:hypothetical protein
VNFLIPEAEDGADTVAWVCKQASCKRLARGEKAFGHPLN